MAIASPTGRRHDIDWLRVCALFLLIVYHNSIAFQEWGIWIGFVQSPDSMPEIWPAMELMNIWRIPILFLIGGIGVWFAMQRRTWKELVRERSLRLLVPLAAGFVFVCPLTNIAAQLYYWREVRYEPNVGHLWFLVNLFAYAILMLPLLYWIKARPQCLWLRFCRALAKFPPALLLFAAPVMLEAWWVDPERFPVFVFNTHGYAIGAVCFFLGFTFAAIGDRFWKSAETMHFPALVFALGLYVLRVLMREEDLWQPEQTANWLIGFESMCWILGWLGMASRYLRAPSLRLNYLNQAVFPVYILHLPVQNAVANFILPTVFPPSVKLALVLIFTLVICFAIYELILRRVAFLRPLFGMKWQSQKF